MPQAPSNQLSDVNIVPTHQSAKLKSTKKVDAATRARMRAGGAVGVIACVVLIFLPPFLIAMHMKSPLPASQSFLSPAEIALSGNHLIREHSPYLLQHAHNPVDWHPWGKEAFDLARKQHKPILLSVGFSACHWCHVMEKESFEDLATASIMNNDFINIKVDREERPDIDQYYVKALSTMGFHAGYPLTVFLTPELKAFTGGTYFPAVKSHGLPAFKDLLNRINNEWQKDPALVRETANTLSKGMLSPSHQEKPPGALSDSATSDRPLFESTLRMLLRQFDTVNGGFGHGRKYPMVPLLRLFMLASRTNYIGLEGGKATCKKIVLITLDSIARGGIHDQIGGGFHRYSTDAKWEVPHFEKMLADNAALIAIYLNGYQLSGRQYFADTAKDTISYLIKDLHSSDGAFYSSRDADNAGKEGDFYAYTPNDLKGLSEPDKQWLEEVLNISDKGNFNDGKSCVPRLSAAPEQLAQHYHISYKEFENRLQQLRAAVLKSRETAQSAPWRDEKIVCSWNALMVSSLAEAYGVFGNDEYLQEAKKTAKFILNKMRKTASAQLKHVLYKDQLLNESFLDDYAYTIQALLDLAAVDADPTWINEAQNLTETMLKTFWAEGQTRFVYTTQKDLPAQTVDNVDEAVPSSTAIAILDLIKMQELTGNAKYGQTGTAALNAVMSQQGGNPAASTAILYARDFSESQLYNVDILNDTSISNEKDMLRCLNSFYFPNKTVLLANYRDLSKYPQAELKDKSVDAGGIKVYICNKDNCLAPSTNTAQLFQQIQSITGVQGQFSSSSGPNSSGPNSAQNSAPNSSQNSSLNSSQNSASKSAPKSSPNSAPNASPNAGQNSGPGADSSGVPKAAMSEDQAINLVTKLPDVKKWLSDLAKSKVKGSGGAAYSVSSENGIMTVQVSESFPDRNVTFGFYNVNTKTGKVQKEVP